ncbi:MAG TPA: AzlD domain-containing protein [Ilumatobacteraceae bacterium]|nr:AzlD domain-containing protein [Ilumatobacteraceae bacterium]
MSWGFVFALGVTAFAFKVLGLVLVGDREMPPVLDRCLALIPAALIAAIVVKDTFSIGQHLQLDARAVGVGAAAIAAWRKLPLVAVIVIGAATTAALRAVA